MNARKTLISAVAALVVTGIASSAMALDGYRERKGLFYGGAVGFGVGRPDVDGAENEVGVNLRARVGGGVTSQLTLDAELGVAKQIDVETNLVTGFMGASFFIVDGLYLKGMGGIAHIAPDQGDSSTGLGVGAGVGYEFFANADLAVGVGADYQRHFYDNFDFGLMNFGITVTVY